MDKNEKKSVATTDFRWSPLAYFGFALFFALTYSLVIRTLDDFYNSKINNDIILHFVVMLLGVVLLFIVCNKFADAIQKKTESFAIVVTSGVLIGLMCLMAFIPKLSIPVLVLCLFLKGFFGSYLYLCWIGVLARYVSWQNICTLVFCIMLGIVWGNYLNNISEISGAGVVTLLSSSLILVLEELPSRNIKVETINKVQMHSVHPLHWRSHISVLLLLFVFTLYICMIYTEQQNGIPSYGGISGTIFTVSALLGMAGIFVNDYLGREFRGDFAMRIGCVALACCLSAAPFIDDTYRIAFLCVFAGFFSYPLMGQLVWLVLTCYRSKVNSVALATESQLGFFVGSILACLLFCALSYFGLSVYCYPVGCLVSILLGIAIVPDSSVDANYLELVGVNKEFEKEKEKESIDLNVDNFISNCKTISKLHNLTARETEVLFLLAKGRSIDYIASELIISPHTARTHAHNIYQKCNVGSRQDLISAVENIGSVVAITEG